MRKKSKIVFRLPKNAYIQSKLIAKPYLIYVCRLYIT